MEIREKTHSTDSSFNDGDDPSEQTIGQTTRPKTVLVLSLRPDVGHIIPLLRAATKFEKRGYEIVCCLPEECRFRAVARGFEFIPILKGLPDGGSNARALFRQLSTKPVVYTSLTTKVLAQYWSPLGEEVVKDLETLLPTLRDHVTGSGSFAFADGEAFEFSLATAAAYLRIPLVLNHSDGSGRIMQRQFVAFRGFTRVPEPIKLTIEAAYWLAGFTMYWWFVIFGGGSVMMRLGRTAITLMGDYRPIPEPLRLSAGLGRIASEKIPEFKSTMPLFGPITEDGPTDDLDSDLQAWIDGDTRPIVYMCFGTMIQLTSEFAGQICEALGQLDVRVLWSLPRRQQEELAMQPPPNFRLETFVPQRTVLACEGVRCVVNHGGAGTVQETLWEGKPLLCIPFMWDQPFNASVVERFGAGIQLPKTEANADRIRAAVDRLIGSEEYSLAAKSIQAELRHQSESEDPIDWVLENLKPEFEVWKRLRPKALRRFPPRPPWQKRPIQGAE